VKINNKYQLSRLMEAHQVVVLWHAKLVTRHNFGA